MDSLVLSSAELALVVEALLEPQDNPEIRHARLLLASKLYPHSTGDSACAVYVRLLDDVSAPQTQVRLDFFPFLLAF
jgi:hypothetical protein